MRCAHRVYTIAEVDAHLSLEESDVRLTHPSVELVTAWLFARGEVVLRGRKRRGLRIIVAGRGVVPARCCLNRIALCEARVCIRLGQQSTSPSSSGWSCTDGGALDCPSRSLARIIFSRGVHSVRSHPMHT